MDDTDIYLDNIEQKETKKNNKIIKIKNDLIKIMAIDLTEKLAADFIHKLFDSIDKDGLSKEELLQKTSAIYENISEHIYGPMFVSFVDRVLKNHNEEGKILFMARDGIVFYEIAKELTKHKHKDKKDKIDIIYLTRKMAGTNDEIAGISEKEINKEILKKYIQQQASNIWNTLLVDAWMYWSLFDFWMQELWWNIDNHPWLVFLYSKNPNITWYLNTVESISSTIKNILIDTTECILPQTHYSPGELEEKEGKVMPKIEKYNNEFLDNRHKSSNIWYKKAVANYINNWNVDIKQELEKLGRLQKSAQKGEFTWMLREITPEWTGKEEFINGRTHGKIKCFGEKKPNDIV